MLSRISNINKKKILLTGSTGMLGKDIYRILSSNNSNIEIFRLTRNVIQDHNLGDQIICDLTDLEGLKRILNILEPDIVIHCAAITDVNLCNLDTSLADKVHVEATKILASNCIRSKFIYISTDSVYDGRQGNFSETDEPSPTNYYAFTKLKGEEQVQKYVNSSYILRTNIFGFLSKSGTSLFEWGIGNFLNNNKIYGYDNIYFNPLFTKELAKIISQFILNEFPVGVYNIGSNEFISKFTFLNYIGSNLMKSNNFLSKKKI